MNPKYPIYIISKGRADSRLTVKALETMRVPYRVVVEPQEVADYARVIAKDNLLVLPFKNLGKGSIPARNWVWEHATNEGHDRHWIMDDNIRAFYRFNRNLKVPVASGSVFQAAEEFTDRYENVPMSGLNYFMFVSRKTTPPPFYLNTRIYSCILLQNGKSIQWRGRYNEDTDLSLRFLKAGYCTILFNAFLAEKTQTMTMKGGSTDELYKQDKSFDGRYEMALHLQKQHPDVTKIVRKWGRWQHSVDYRPFRGNQLIKKANAKHGEGVNNYGMKLVENK